MNLNFNNKTIKDYDIILNVVTEFGMVTGARYKEEGDFSGEEFRDEILYPKVKEAIDKKCKLIIILDGSYGYGCGFLEESFGGLIRVKGLTKKQITKTIGLISYEEPYLIKEITNYINDAEDTKGYQPTTGYQPKNNNKLNKCKLPQRGSGERKLDKDNETADNDLKEYLDMKILSVKKIDADSKLVRVPNGWIYEGKYTNSITSRFIPEKFNNIHI